MKKKRTNFSAFVIFLIFAMIYSFYHLNANVDRLVIGTLVFASIPTAMYILLKRPIKNWYRRKYDKRYIYSMDKPIQKRKMLESLDEDANEKDSSVQPS